MANGSNLRTGGELLVDALRIHGADTAFCVPGESYLATLDAFHDVQDDIKVIVCRQEGGAANMADAYGKLTGRPGICFVTRGPGATNASVGIHTAYQDSTPLILFVGQVARAMTEREAFQEIDFRRMFGQMSKWTAQIDDPARIPEMVSRAFHVATSGRPGPVVLALPEDMQSERAAIGLEAGCYTEVQPHPGPDDIAAFRDMLAAAKRPLMLVGGAPWTEQGRADIMAFAEANNVPATTSFRRQDMFDNRHPCYAGVVGLGMNSKLLSRIDEADLLIVVGPQLNEIITQGYTMLDLPRPKQKLVHVCAGTGELGKVYQADLPINASPANFGAALRGLEPVDSSAWSESAKTARADYEAFCNPPAAPGDVNLSEIMLWLDANLPEDAIVTNGAGNYAVWVHRFFRYKGFRSQLAPQSGAMGYGVPSGVAAGIVHPDRTVVSFSGDGCYMMNGQELATAVQYGVKTVFIVVNNGMYGTIRMHQERHYPSRVVATGLNNPDFAALAQAYGAHGEVVESTADFAAAFDRARAADGPALIELRVDPEAITPVTTLTAIRESSG